jgi:scavenger mRNA decapping enzyme DcpS-like protein
MDRRLLLALGLGFGSGVIVGAYLFANSQPRSFLAIQPCNGTCLRAEELTGLLASAGIQRFPQLIPNVVKETDRCAAIRYPFASEDRRHFHYVIFPKKDIKNIADVALEDQPYLWDCLGVMRSVILEHGLRNYRVTTNGPGLQDVGYLHFHIVPK